jgi:hypothetical protein
MKNVSNEFKNIIKSGGPFYAYASITLKNGKNLTLDSDNDFFISGNGYTEDGGDGFPLGSALSKSVTLVIDNIDERFSKYDFYYAQISLFTEVDIESRSYDAWRDVKGEEILDVNGNTIMLTKSRIERLNEGTFTVLEPIAVGDTIELVGYDSMYKADADFTSKLSYPTTAGQLLREACSTCNITLGSPKFKNDDFVIEQAPEKVTCREVIGYIAMLAVGNAVIQNGTLVIKSYDFSAISKITNRDDLVEDVGYSILMDYQSNPDISTDPVVITGIATTKKVENESTILIRGTDDYALEITNPLIEGHEDDAINLIGDVLIGVKLRGFSGEFFPDPTIEFMDQACVVDRKDKVYPTFITSLEFNYLGSSSFSCGIKDPERQKSTYYSEATKVYEKAKKEIKQNKTEFEAAVDNLNKTLESASGMYSTEVVQPDGSVISYIHDKPTVEESKNVIKVTSEAIGISSDGGKTYPYGLFLTGDLITRILYAIGINADYINSGSLTVKDKNGNITFYADTETGRVTINAESISITGKSVEDISNGIVDDFVTNIYKTDMDEIKNSVRNKIETWYQNSDPSVNWGITIEKPWCDIDGNPILDVNGNEITLLFEELKSEHEGDLWKDLSTNDEYIYRSGHWVKMQVPDEVFDEIDGKAQVFINTPVPPYRVGDLWFDADTQEILTCVESRDTGKCVKSDWQKKTKYTDDSGLNSFIKSVYDPKIAELQSQIDGQIETWFYDHEPSLQNEPAVNWTTNEQRKEHEGDLFFWKSTGYSYRFLQDGAVWKWQIVQDTDISKALAAAEKAQDTADHKRRVFVVTPQPPYDIGDLWVQGDDGDIMRCCVARSESASFSASDWEKASKYTDDTRANEVQKELETVNKDLQNQIDGKIETYNQSADPAASWTTAELKAKHTGDLWYNSKTEETMRWNGSAWSKLSDADAKAAKNLAVTKKRVFSVTPYPPYDTDDLWVQGTNGDLMRCVTSRQSGEYVASDWVKATKYTDDSAVDKLNKALTSEEVFNRLTDNGKKQGIYLQGDQLYINFSYGKGGTLTLGGVNNENGSIQILDAIGAEVGKWDKDGLNIKKGSIYGSTIYLDKEKASALIVGRNNSKEIFTIGSMGMHIDNTNMGLLASDSMVVDLMGGWFHGLRMKASNNGRGYGSSISPECFSIGWAEDLQGWSDAMSPVKSYTFSISENSTGCLSIRINGSNYINDYVDISPREIKTTGTKNRVVPTENYSNRLQYCYETASPMFGDIGEGITDENGECIVEIGDIFTETVTTRIEYQVFLQKEGEGDLWIEKKEENYFIVHGTPNLKFAWELKAKQKDYEYVNLEEDVDREEELPESPENILNAELETLIKEQEELLNETA